MRTHRGFSLIELLIVVAIILTIAAIAIPNLLQARIAANESAAAASLKTLQTAEITYFGAYPAIGYADSLAQLGGPNPCATSSVTACLIDSVLSSAAPGGAGKGGYYFRATGIMTAGATTNTAYVVATAPIRVNQSGNRDFCSNNDAVLRSQMGSPGDLPVTTITDCFSYPVSQ